MNAATSLPRPQLTSSESKVRPSGARTPSGFQANRQTRYSTMSRNPVRRRLGADSIDPFMLAADQSLESSVRYVRGVGPERAELLARLHIRTVGGGRGEWESYSLRPTMAA